MGTGVGVAPAGGQGSAGAQPLRLPGHAGVSRRGGGVRSQCSASTGLLLSEGEELPGCAAGDPGGAAGAARSAVGRAAAQPGGPGCLWGSSASPPGGVPGCRC